MHLIKGSVFVKLLQEVEKDLAPRNNNPPVQESSCVTM